MATVKKDALPEIIVDKNAGPRFRVLADMAHEALVARGKTVEASAEEDTAKKQVASESEILLQEEMAKDNYIGVIRIATEDAPVRVEFRMENGALEIAEEANLDKLFGASRPQLFAREKVVTEVTSPQQLIEGLQKNNYNPWDIFELKLKKGLDPIVDILEKSAPGCVVTAEAILPKKGFLSTLNTIAKHLSTEAKDYVRKYLDEVLETRVVLGTKAKGGD